MCMCMKVLLSVNIKQKKGKAFRFVVVTAAITSCVTSQNENSTESMCIRDEEKCARRDEEAI